MKIVSIQHIFLLCIIGVACTKGSNNYTPIDHTVGMTKNKQWSGTSSGYTKGDTIIPPSITKIDWPVKFGRHLLDTAITVQSVNGFVVSMLGTALNYRSTDSINKIVVFDTVLSGSAKTVLTFYYAKDSMTYQFHKQDGLNATTGTYYYTDDTLHTD